MVVRLTNHPSPASFLMSYTPSLSLMNLREYVDYLEQTAVMFDTDPHEVNRVHRFQIEDVSDARYESAKWELYARARANQ